MKLVATAIFGLLVVVQMTSGMGEDCESPMNIFGSLVGKSVLEMMKLKMKYKSKSCLFVLPPDGLESRVKECLAEFAMTAINDTLNSTLPVEPNNMVQWYGEFHLCKLDALEVPYDEETGFKPQDFKEKIMLDQWKGKPEHLKIFKEFFNKCVDSSVNSEGVLDQMLSVDICLTKELRTYCEEQGRPKPGLMWTSFFHTLMQEPKCDAVQLSPEYLQAGKDCFDEYIGKWNARVVPEMKDEPKMKQEMRSVMNFAKNYGMEVVYKTYGCLGEKMNYYDMSSAVLNYTKMGEILMSFDGWTEEQKSSLSQTLMECATTPSSGAMEDEESDEAEDEEENIQNAMMNKMNMMKKLKMMFKSHSKFQKCFAPKFMSLCGLNNEVMKFMYPVMNNHVSGLIVDDLRKRDESKILMKFIKPLKSMLYGTMGEDTNMY